MSKDNRKDIADSLNRTVDYAHKGTNLLLDSANNINKWYAQNLKEIAESKADTSRIETGIDDEIENNEEKISKKLETKVDKYNEIQTDQKGRFKQYGSNKLQTVANSKNKIVQGIKTKDDSKKVILQKYDKKLKNTKRIETLIKGIKTINNATHKAIKTGKNISKGLNEDGTSNFQTSSSKIMTKPIKKLSKKAIKKTTKYVKKASVKATKKAIKVTKDIIIKATKLIIKLIANVMKLIVSMLPEIAPVLIILVIVIAFCSFFGLGMSKETRNNYETYMINTQKEYDDITVAFYNEGKVVDGAIEGKGMINWKAPLSIIQILNGNLIFDEAEQELLEKFKNAGLFEQIRDESYTYEKEIEDADSNNLEEKQTEMIVESKKIIKNSSLDEYIEWCNNNFEEINIYKDKKNLNYDENQTKFTDGEIEQIKLLYNSSSFFDLFGTDFKSTYAYLNVNIGDEQIQAIYDEFLRNAGKRYLMDHSNLKYDECMEYYDCSSWVIHCLAHSGIITMQNTTAKGIYETYCYSIGKEDRKSGDLIFLKDTYDTGEPGSISHIGIYIGKLTINDEVAEWVIDTGSNPTGVRITKYNNGWWNGSDFYGFGRLKEN